ncbi:MAG: cytochrome c biogenesis protein CcsA [Candidatus Lokiarchaeota archaeon]|nr:cytochrome c biogenesis protein CcsA [Candidatus Lokiarchaeota archaeon]
MLILNIGIIIGISLILPILLDLIEISRRILLISYLGTGLIIFLVILMLLDIAFLFFQKQNIYLFSLLNMSITLLMFLLMMYSFLNNIFEFVNVMNYSETTQPLIYKIVAIWAGQDGSIMIWILFNSIMINFFRINNQNKEDLVFIRSIIMSLIISSIFTIILFTMNPFNIDLTPDVPGGIGLNPLLISPFMIWHPFFTFLAYAIFLVPFTIIIAEVISRNSKLLNSYQQNFYDFSLKFGWLVSTLSIGLGAYWAKIALNWGRYWGWDPVEVVSLVPWFFITAFFHTIIFKKKNPILIKINVSLIFLSIIFSTLITRTGNLSPLHSFTGGSELLIWLIIVGLILVILPLYVIYIVLDYLTIEYKKKKLFFDYLSYILLFGLSFVCIFGLFIPPFTLFLSSYFPLDVIYIGPDYFIITTLILSVGLALTLIFCSLWEYFDIKWIALAIAIGLTVQSVFSFTLLLILDIWINPLLIIFFISIIASFYKLANNFEIRKGIKYFFRLNSKTIIHAGISFILVGFLIDPNLELYQDIFFITGFILLIIGIIPSIFSVFFTKKEEVVS